MRCQYLIRIAFWELTGFNAKTNFGLLSLRWRSSRVSIRNTSIVQVTILAIYSRFCSALFSWAISKLDKLYCKLDCKEDASSYCIQFYASFVSDGQFCPNPVPCSRVKDENVNRVTFKRPRQFCFLRQWILKCSCLQWWISGGGGVSPPSLGTFVNSIYYYSLVVTCV